MATPDADEMTTLDPMKLMKLDGSMEKGLMGELVTPTEASTSCPTSTSPSRVQSPRGSKGTADSGYGDFEDVNAASVMVDRVLEEALKGDSESRAPASPKRKAKVAKKKDEKKNLVLSIPPVQQPAAPPSPSKRTALGASQQGWRTPTASPQHQANAFRSPDRAPLVNRCAVQWTPCSSPFGEDRFAMSPDAACLPPSPYTTERSAPCCPEEGYGDFRSYPPPPTGPPPPQPGSYDPQWGQGWECWDEGVDTPSNMNVSMPRYSGECWGNNEPAWSPPLQQNGTLMPQGCGGWGDAMPLNRKGRAGLGGKKKPDKMTAFLPDTASSRTTPKSDATSTPSARATPTAGRLPNQYSGMQFSYAVSAAPPPPPSQQYKKATTPTARTLRDGASRKPDLFAEVCKVILSENCEIRLRVYENMPYED
jgi:hypothetical protein